MSNAQSAPLIGCPPQYAKHGKEEFKGDGPAKTGNAAMVAYSDVSKSVFMLMAPVFSVFAAAIESKLYILFSYIYVLQI
jgi:hypothetical protein